MSRFSNEYFIGVQKDSTHITIILSKNDKCAEYSKYKDIQTLLISPNSDMTSQTGCLILLFIFLMEMVSPSISMVTSLEPENPTYKFSLEADDFDKELGEISLGELMKALQEILLLLQTELDAIPRFRRANGEEAAIRCLSKLFGLIRGIIGNLLPK